MKNLISVLFFVVVTFFCQAQKDSLAIVNTFSKAKKIYNTSDFKLKTAYKAYITKNKDSLVQSYEGEVVKQGSYCHSKMGNTEIIQNDKRMLTISHQEKLVQYSILKQVKGLQQLPKIEEIIPLFAFYKFEESAQGFKCVFKSPKVTQLPFTKVEILFDKKYNIRNQTMYMADAIPYTVKNKQYYASTRIEIEFTEMQNIVEFLVKKNIEDYITIQNQTSKVTLKNNLKGYQLVEL